MAILYRVMEIADYRAVYALWQHTPGIGLSKADSYDRIEAFLTRNPALSFVALDDEQVIGTALCGHDGRRGYLHHVAVAVDYRRRGIGEDLVNHCLFALGMVGIDKCHLFIKVDNEDGRAFWQRLAWDERGDIVMASKFIDG